MVIELLIFDEDSVKSGMIVITSSGIIKQKLQKVKYYPSYIDGYIFGFQPSFVVNGAAPSAFVKSLMQNIDKK